MSRRLRGVPREIATSLKGDRLQWYIDQLCSKPIRRERDLQRLVEEILTLRGVWFFHLSDPSTKYNRPGVPDLICCIDGRFLALELKMPKGKITKHQKKEHERIKACEGLVFVVRSVREAVNILEEL